MPKLHLFILALLFIACRTFSANAEQLHLGVSQDTIAITSNFNGTNLVIFGSVEGGDPLIQAQNGYDVIVVLEGPAQPASIRAKARILGIWVNAAERIIKNMPGSYSVASTRAFDEIANSVTFRGLGVGLAQLKVQVDNDDDNKFSEAFLRLKQKNGLYIENNGSVEFLSSALFKASVEIPADIPIGQHTVKGYLFKDGALVGTANTPMVVKKSGFESFVYNSAQNHGLLYGLVCVILAMFSGWFASAIFRKK